ncbi:hypothetical protein DD237_004743 [Peronospora effusa]|uniref:Myb-like domain-containing protein n=1 Tax=Peronospora effusa TaxID=542832 RepID=A0A425CBT2_9STRA|nr:hypothetical protein DD237_004743 [Peronospora effusa]
MISPKVMTELHQAKLVPTQFTVPKPGENAWSPAEQRRFWEAIQHFPQGPWTAIAVYVGSKSTRQAMTHAQKLRQKLSRWKRRVRSDSIGSTGSNSSASASVTTPGEGSNGHESPPMSPTEPEVIKKDKDRDGCKPMRIMKLEFKDEVQESEDHGQVHDAHDDLYLEHLLSDIEPVLEHVAHFTNGSGNDEATEYGNEQTMYPTHHANMAASSDHKTMELSMWNQHHQNSTYCQQQHQYSSPSTLAATHYTPTETGHQHNYHFLI